jgi:hypothetical protein
MTTPVCERNGRGMFYTDGNPEGIRLPKDTEQIKPPQNHESHQIDLLLAAILGQLEKLGNSL